MKRLQMILLALLLPLAALAQPVVNEAGMITFTLDNEKSSMSITGGSTVGSWDAEVKMVEADFGIDVEALVNGSSHEDRVFELAAFRVPVGGIDSDSRRMNNNISKYLKEDDHPHVSFSLNNAQVQSRDGNTFDVLVNGIINAAGNNKEVALNARLLLKDDGTMEIHGTKAMLFSDFNIDRPSAMLGTVRADEEIEVHFNLILTTK